MEYLCAYNLMFLPILYVQQKHTKLSVGLWIYENSFLRFIVWHLNWCKV